MVQTKAKEKQILLWLKLCKDTTLSYLFEACSDKLILSKYTHEV